MVSLSKRYEMSSGSLANTVYTRLHYSSDTSKLTVESAYTHALLSDQLTIYIYNT